MQVRHIEKDFHDEQYINVYLHYHDLIVKCHIMNGGSQIHQITCRFKNETEHFDIWVYNSGCQVKKNFKNHTLDSHKNNVVKSLLQELNEMFYGNNLVKLN